jgi:hypothetical protein
VSDPYQCIEPPRLIRYRFCFDRERARILEESNETHRRNDRWVRGHRRGHLLGGVAGSLDAGDHRGAAG